MASSTSGKPDALVYDAASKESFNSFFTKPKAKAGRPKKRKRGRPKNKQPKSTTCAQTTMKVIDLTVKEKQQLDAAVEGTIAAAKQQPEVIRINWDREGNKQIRARIADSWCGKKDLYRAGESFTLFCQRNNISRNVLKRFLELRLKHDCDKARSKKQRRPRPTRKKRGRPALLSKSIMRHLCEG